MRLLRRLLERLIPRPQTPRYTVVEIEKPIPILDRADEAAMAGLQNHPGMMALLNRLRLQRSALTTQLVTGRFKEIQDVYSLQYRIAGLGYVESEIRLATSNIENRKTRPASEYEVEEFEKVLRSIESVGNTTPE